MRNGLTTSLLGITLLSWVSVEPYSAFAGSLADFFGNLAASQGSPYERDPQATAAAAEGMKLLAELVEKYGYDRQRAWMAFLQTSEGQRIRHVPGALSLLTDWFNAVMALPSGRDSGLNSAQGQQPPRTQQSRDTTLSGPQAINQDANEVGGSLTPPFLGPYRPNAYGPGINSDATGRPFIWQSDQGPTDPSAKVRPDVFGPGIGMDQYGTPVRAACPPFQQFC
jgi:hypothetical protein